MDPPSLTPLQSVVFVGPFLSSSRSVFFSVEAQKLPPDTVTQQTPCTSSKLARQDVDVHGRFSPTCGLPFRIKPAGLAWSASRKMHVERAEPRGKKGKRKTTSGSEGGTRRRTPARTSAHTFAVCATAGAHAAQAGQRRWMAEGGA